MDNGKRWKTKIKQRRILVREEEGEEDYMKRRRNDNIELEKLPCLVPIPNPTYNCL